MQKTCTKCGILKAPEDFPLDRGNRKNKCKVCTSSYLREYRSANASIIAEKASKKYQANRDVILIKDKQYHDRPEVKERNKKNQKRHYDENPELFAARNRENRKRNRNALNEYSRQYYAENKDSLREGFSQYHQIHREERLQYKRQYLIDNMAQCIARNNAYVKRRKAYDLNFKLSIALRVRISCALKNNQKSGSAVKDLGCTIPELKLYIEKQFQPGMTWENWSHSGWHLDHIVPVSLFDLTDPTQFKQACHYTNLQPLWAKENIRKSNNLP